MPEQSLTLRSDQEAQALVGRHDQHVRRIEQALGVSLLLRGEALKISGPDPAVAKAARLC